MAPVEVVAGAVAGVAMGYVLQRSQLCFHSAWSGLYERRTGLFRAWLLAVALGSVGLAAVYSVDSWSLSEGLAFNPVANITGGLLIGVGMVIALSCVSGLYFKLGAGMLGALIGLAGWALGEAAAIDVELPGESTVLSGGPDGTIPHVLGVPRLVIAVPFLVAVVAYLWRRRDGVAEPDKDWQWRWPLAGLALGVVLLLGWVTAGMVDHPFGPSSVGAVRSLIEPGREPQVWLIAFLVALVPGAFVAAATAGGLWVRGETKVRYAQLAVGGFLLGAGGLIGGGCNLGHGLSGVAQLNVSSWVVVASIIAGIGLARAVRARLGSPPPLPVELGGPVPSHPGVTP